MRAAPATPIESLLFSSLRRRSRTSRLPAEAPGRALSWKAGSRFTDALGGDVGRAGWRATPAQCSD
jgi:hypothetical protein